MSRTNALMVAQASPGNIKACGDAPNRLRIYHNSDETPTDFVGEFQRCLMIGCWWGNQQSHINHQGRQERLVVVADQRPYLCNLQWDKKLLELDLQTYQTRGTLLPGYRHSYY